jgi:prepilin-type N-terminal cleavage/methylation domain-containing protein
MDRIVKCRRGQGAFTLLEVVLAVTILGLVMTAVYATWSAGLNGWKRGSAISAAFQRERVVMDTLTELASTIVYFNSPDEVYAVQATHDDWKGDTVSFVTSSDVSLPQTESSIAGMRRVTIALERDEQGNPFLAIVNTPALEPADSSSQDETHVLSADVCGFQVRYRDPLDESWKDEWENTRAIPSAIEFTVAFGGSDGQTPPVIVTRAVDVPIAQFAMQTQGLQMNQQSTTNQVERRNINLVQPLPTDTGTGAE